MTENIGFQQNVNCFRRLKRRIRKRFKWNSLPMRYQLRVHLLSLFGFFFLVYFTFMIIFTQSNYITEVVTVVNSQLEPILRDRLRYSTESVSTTIYMADKIGID